MIEWQSPLYEHYEVIACDYPQDRKTTYEELADAAAEKLASQSQGKPAVVLAESFGGGVAIQFALRHPELVERLILVNTFARFPNRVIVRTVALFSHLLPRRRLDGFLRTIQGRMLFRPDLPQSDKDKFWEIVKDVPMSALGRRLRMLARLDLRSELPKINVPTLVMVSPIDKTVHPKASRELGHVASQGLPPGNPRGPCDVDPSPSQRAPMAKRFTELESRIAIGATITPRNSRR